MNPTELTEEQIDLIVHALRELERRIDAAYVQGDAAIDKYRDDCHDLAETVLKWKRG